MLECEEAKRSAGRFKSRGPTLCFAMVVGMTISSTGACQKLEISEQGKSIVIDREVLVPGLAGKPNAITRLPSGGFVIVGARGTAWAAGTDANGKLLWKYEEPLDPKVNTQNQSEFHGVVPLKDGKSLLCGETGTNDYQAGFIVVIDGNGHVVERRTVFPNDDHSMFSSSFRKCTAWGDGFAIVGSGANGRKGFAWLMKLDKNGKKEWEKFDSDLPGIDIGVTPSGMLVLAGSPTGLEGTSIAVVNEKGDLIAHRKTNYLDANIAFSVNQNAGVRLVAVDNHNNNILLSLDEKLQDVESSTRIGPPTIRDGCAYALPDGSVVLFGNRGGPVYRSAIGWVNRRGKDDDVREMSVPMQQDASFSLRDAVALSSNQFVAMRDQVSSINPTNTGVVLSWVTFK